MKEKFATSYTEQWKANGAENLAFDTWQKACNYLLEHEFEYIEEAGLFHNGRTKAFIDKIKVEEL